MKKTLYYLVYIVFLAYQMTMMYNKTNMAIEEEWNPFNPIYYLFLIASAIGFCILSKQRCKLPLFGKSFLVFYGYVILITLYHAFANPASFLGPSVILEGCVPLSLFFVSFFAYQDEEMVKITKPILFVVFLAFTFGYVYGYSITTDYRQMEFVEQNNSYVFIFILPYIALINHQDKKLKYYILATLVAVIVSMKRGGIVGIMFGLTAYFYIKQNAKGRTKKTPFINASFMMLGVFLIYYFINSYMGGVVTDRFYEISETGGSGRDLIWLETTNAISASNLTEQFIGHGWNTVKNYTVWGIGAHNDYLETIFDFGWIGFVLFIIFIVSTIVFLFKNKNLNFSAPLGMAIFSYIAIAFVCHIIPQTEYFDLFSLAIGGACGAYAMNDKQQRLILLKKNIDTNISIHT